MPTKIRLNTNRKCWLSSGQGGKTCAHSPWSWGVVGNGGEWSGLTLLTWLVTDISALTVHYHLRRNKLNAFFGKKYIFVTKLCLKGHISKFVISYGHVITRQYHYFSPLDAINAFSNFPNPCHWLLQHPPRRLLRYENTIVEFMSIWRTS